MPSPNEILNEVFLGERPMSPTPFKLYPFDSPTFFAKDYALLMEQARGAKSALEFGPGSSTLALIEVGVGRILTCEYDEGWREKAKEKFKDFPQVEIIPFYDEPEARADIEGQFDIAFVDSPKGYKNIPGLTPPGGRKRHKGQEDCSRLNTCLLALKHAPVVLLHDAARPLERGTLCRLSAMGHKVTMLNASRAGMARIDRCPKQEPS
jgi:hypothetical protein